MQPFGPACGARKDSCPAFPWRFCRLHDPSLPCSSRRPLPLVPEGLTRLAPAVERAGIHLGVWEEPDGIVVWGTTRTLPPYCFVLEVVSPGVLVLKHSPGEDSGKFANVAVLEGNKIKILAQHFLAPAQESRNCPDHLHSLLELGQSSQLDSPANILLQLAVSMRAHGRGGTLLVVPDTRPNGSSPCIPSPIRWIRR